MFCPNRRLLGRIAQPENQKVFMSMFESKQARKRHRTALLRYNKRISSLGIDHAKDMPSMKSFHQQMTKGFFSYFIITLTLNFFSRHVC